MSERLFALNVGSCEDSKIDKDMAPAIPDILSPPRAGAFLSLAGISLICPQHLPR
jgi:hypothetical protein